MVAQARKERLDLLVTQQGLAENQEHARRLIMAGRVSIGDRVVDKPGMRVSGESDVTVKDQSPYVSRGGFKLAAALEAFGLDVRGWTVADVGSSTGGFVDCLLQRGAGRVYAIDVGYGQLAWKLRQDPRVVVMERTNARYLETLPESVALVTADVSFISLKLILPAASGWLRDQGQIVALIKPQFEASAEQVEEGGVVRDKAVHRAVLEDLVAWASSQGMGLSGLIRSPLTGPAGNVEFLAHWVPGLRAGSDAVTLIRDCTD
jgi:23S rRNA (cytidine1920-2'-O)/16S rRNA (cytidine1409-2'-O)-methyltransferase